MHCPPLPHGAELSTPAMSTVATSPAFSKTPFLTVPLCPLPQIPSILADIPSRQRLRSSLSDDQLAPAVRLPTIGRRAFLVAGVRRSYYGSTYRSMSPQHHLCSASNKKAQLSLTNPRDAKACRNCFNSACLQRCR